MNVFLFSMLMVLVVDRVKVFRRKKQKFRIVRMGISRGGERGGRGGAAAPPDLLKNFLCINSILLINIVKGYLPLLTEATF